MNSGTGGSRKMSADNDDKKISIVSSREIFFHGIKDILESYRNYGFEWIQDSIGFINEINSSGASKNFFILDCQCPETYKLNILNILKDRINEHNILCVVPKISRELEFEYLQFGVKGIIEESETSENYLKAVDCLLSGHMWIRRDVMEEFINSVLTVKSYSKATNENHLSELTKREIDILSLVAKNYSNSDIADNLFITEKTVKNYLTKIYKKLNIHSRREVKTKIKPLISKDTDSYN